MKLTTAVLALFCLSGTVALADPLPINQASKGATTYSFFLIKENKLKNMSVAQATSNLAQAVQPYGVTPCIVAGDTNASIACGVPSSPTFMLAAPGEFLTYDLANFQDLPPIKDRRVFNKDSAYNQVYAVNFLSPVGNIPGDSAGRSPVHVRFSVPVTEFSMLVDGGQAIAPASDNIQFVVNGVTLAPQSYVAGTPTVIGVWDPAGFTEVAIIAGGGQTQAFLADRFSFVPMP